MAGSIAGRARVRKTLKPGRRGTLRYVRQYGDRLVCVRRRVDEKRLRRYTTVEVVVEEREMELPPRTVVGVRVRLDEPVLRQRVKAAGGQWNRSDQVWEMTFGAVQALSLEDRIVMGPHLATQVSNAGPMRPDLSTTNPKRRSA